MVEDPKNPPKDSMVKIGTVSIAIEPHVVEATMYAVKGSKKELDPSQTKWRPGLTPQPPYIQYGPFGGAMPPQVPPATPSTPAPVTPATSSPAPNLAQPSPKPQTVPPNEPPKPVAPTPPPSAASKPAPSASPIAPPVATPAPATVPAPALPAVPAAAAVATPSPMARPASTPVLAPAQAATPSVSKPAPAASPAPTAATPAPPTGPIKAATPATGTTAAAAPATKPTANDPVIALLAQKASNDPKLKDLMRTVAVGQASKEELKQFQSIIDNLHAEYRRSGGQQGPSADRLLVDGRTVKYFADEVRTILDIVLASNPNQKSTDLRPPPRSDPLVVLLVKTALEDQRTKDMIKRIADGRPGFNDATTLKETLDRLHRDAKITPKASPAPLARPAAPNGTPAIQPNGQAKAPQTLLHNSGGSPNPQALRAKGLPPGPKHDISAVVLDFGSGDRYRFPKFSILEYLPTTSGQQVVASFLLVHRGSSSQWGNPLEDYYQPVTIRLYTPTGRHLENLARAVATQDEVNRYMNEVMKHMTRAEYVLLAMRLPREGHEGEKNGAEEPTTNGPTTQPAAEEVRPYSTWLSTDVIWKALKTKPSKRSRRVATPEPDEEDERRYKRILNAYAVKDEAI